MAAAALGGGMLGAYVHAGTSRHLPPVATPNVKAASPIPPATPAAKETFIGLPVRIIIPAVKVDAKIEYVGTNSKGEMEAPAQALNAAWYKYGALPGDPGSAVIDGHVLGLKGEPGVFEHLDGIRVNDEIQILDGHGQTITFSVRETKLYGGNDHPAEVFNSSDGRAHLNLITCAGDWDPKAHKYLKRLVIFADRTDIH